MYTPPGPGLSSVDFLCIIFQLFKTPFPGRLLYRILDVYDTGSFQPCVFLAIACIVPDI